ncbi:hypothetical protein O7627_33160 [Solwaraspora sp. WMMD1047]|uniref:hypothetical protein n=1 Tax=Solwaraspora sp. WMMD1047 TaxID=3016102 RepID=UPI0024170259|nr:hypothetical protein [Solwaraspora sp. WMMD1047]MDG4834115.1 hypothetical protein [Solwaraspora sp. WMMD1047]
MAVIRAWLRGGPADGRVDTIECAADGSVPPTVVLPQTGLYLASSDEPAPAVNHIYALSDDDGDDGDDFWDVVYRYQPHPGTR